MLLKTLCCYGNQRFIREILKSSIGIYRQLVQTSLCSSSLHALQTRNYYDKFYDDLVLQNLFWFTCTEQWVFVWKERTLQRDFGTTLTNLKLIDSLKFHLKSFILLRQRSLEYISWKFMTFLLLLTNGIL